MQQRHYRHPLQQHCHARQVSTHTHIFFSFLNILNIHHLISVPGCLLLTFVSLMILPHCFRSKSTQNRRPQLQKRTQHPEGGTIYLSIQLEMPHTHARARKNAQHTAHRTRHSPSHFYISKQ